ncbi:MAG: hypothetical protein JW834_02410 [Candidatus Diapherotrites archaeon]|nr:hypothetical protein [Candidatus Diapherotrites archaeon]
MPEGKRRKVVKPPRAGEPSAPAREGLRDRLSPPQKGGAVGVTLKDIELGAALRIISNIPTLAGLENEPPEEIVRAVRSLVPTEFDDSVREELARQPEGVISPAFPVTELSPQEIDDAVAQAKAVPIPTGLLERIQAMAEKDPEIRDKYEAIGLLNQARGGMLNKLSTSELNEKLKGVDPDIAHYVRSLMLKSGSINLQLKNLASGEHKSNEQVRDVLDWMTKRAEGYRSLWDHVNSLRETQRRFEANAIHGEWDREKQVEMKEKHFPKWVGLVPEEDVRELSQLLKDLRETRDPSTVGENRAYSGFKELYGVLKQLRPRNHSIVPELASGIKKLNDARPSARNVFNKYNELLNSTRFSQDVIPDELFSNVSKIYDVVYEWNRLKRLAQQALAEPWQEAAEPGQSEELRRVLRVADKTITGAVAEGEDLVNQLGFDHPRTKRLQELLRTLNRRGDEYLAFVEEDHLTGGKSTIAQEGMDAVHKLMDEARREMDLLHKGDEFSVENSLVEMSIAQAEAGRLPSIDLDSLSQWVKEGIVSESKVTKLVGLYEKLVAKNAEKPKPSEEKPEPVAEPQKPRTVEESLTAMWPLIYRLDANQSVDLYAHSKGAPQSPVRRFFENPDGFRLVISGGDVDLIHLDALRKLSRHLATDPNFTISSVPSMGTYVIKRRKQ